VVRQDGAVLPVVTPAEMAAIDAAATEPVHELIERAGAAVARRALAMLGGSYGRRIAVLAGKGNNGNDGRVAAARLAARGVHVRVHDATERPARLEHVDLVIDAAYGTGFHGSWHPPAVGGAPVLAVDIPSGVDGLTGQIPTGVLEAVHTVTFAALKPGLLLAPGAAVAGELEVVDIGLDTSSARAHWVQGDDLRRWLPHRGAAAHKWVAAVEVVAGSPGMEGAAHLASRAAMRAGAGMVRLGSPGAPPGAWVPTEVVGTALPAAQWDRVVLDGLDRIHALVVGPGLGRSDATATAVRSLVAQAPRPLVVDGDGLWALAWNGDGAAGVLRDREHGTVLTPHDGEYALLAGVRVGPDRLDAARTLAARTGAVVLLKGATTVVAAPDGMVLVVTAGDHRLATAGTGDVLSGIVGALLAQRVPPFEAAAAAAEWHGRAGRLGPTGLVAGDLPDLLPRVRAELERSP
jgi:NAD(P)H-hydrate epimerase